MVPLSRTDMSSNSLDTKGTDGHDLHPYARPNSDKYMKVEEIRGE